VHSHHMNTSPERLRQIAAEMDQMNMVLSVNLSGRQGAALKARTDNIKAAAPNHFVVFANLNFLCAGPSGNTSGCVDSPGWT
ncbi:hypothetical protein, partial [Salmonella sp. SAL4458]|uniref:hypothetical protein n=1 Tax=Salmonella sp. SAL4458 TaxID=3159913 RepID=UPI0039797355